MKRGIRIPPRRSFWHPPRQGCRGFQLLTPCSGGKQLRFAVQRPGSPDASPRSHRMPCGDIPGRVHVSVAGVSAGHAREESLALAALRCDVPARRAPGPQPPGLCARLGQLAALLQISRRARPARTPPRLLLTCQVPDEPSVRAVLPQHLLLGGGWAQTVPGHESNITATTDIPGEVKRRFRTRLKTDVSTPRIG